MQESNKLTTKEFWSDGWKDIHLPARYFYNDYSRKIIASLLEKVIPLSAVSFLEIGGCPGRWADFFHTKYKMVSDSMDYDENNIEILKENYRLIGINGEVFLGDITDTNVKPDRKYDVVLSEGLIEHFIDSKDVFENHLKYLKSGGILIIGVPNIKKSWLYDYFARFDARGYVGYRHVGKSELEGYAKKCDLEILYCGYTGVFNLGVAYTNELGFILGKVYIVASLVSSFFLNLLRIKRETRFFSPYIYLIARKYE